jgi:molybdopterin converting factor small subunit
VPTVYIPALLREITGGRESVEISGATVREVIDNLERIHPGIKNSLVDGERLKSNISVAVDGAVSPLGLLERVNPNSEIHFVAAISGGARFLE